ncbi:hypothetical protein [Cobetia sp. 5-11-6-3]|uniref:hypothetical protein n=1 Tax=Cobetia sp. 5-11-6-3 TaxID=2737458 RepID=UPI001596D09E|nr:hypothetical protein [Cobetia sp. 5-11-6-3]
MADFEWPTFGGGRGDMTKHVIDADSIHANLRDLLPVDRLAEMEPLVQLASDIVAKNNLHTVILKLPEAPSQPKWGKGYMTSELAADCQEKLTEPNTILHLKCPLYIQRKNSSPDESYFDMYITRDYSDHSRKPRFIREGITIPEDRVSKVRGYTSLVVVGSGPLATLLGDSENPAHTEWEKNATKFKGKYKWGPSTIDFVRLSVGKAIQLMSQGDKEQDYTLLSDIFYLEQPESEEEVPDQRLKKKKKEAGDQAESSPPKPHEARPRHYRLSKIDGGFILKGPREPMPLTRSFRVTVAYDFVGASKISALKKYHKNDFSLDKARYVDQPQARNVENLEVGGNTLEFTAQTNDFEVSVTGFDNERDIIVDVKSEALKTDEKI